MTNAERTAAYVAMQRRIGVDAKRRRVPRPRFPKLIEADYAAQLVAIVERWRQLLAPLMAELPSMVETVRRERLDVERLDIGEGRRTRIFLDRARDGTATAARAVEPIAQRYAEQVAQHQKREFARQTKAGLGVELTTADRKLPALIEHFVHDNVSLIKKLGGSYVADVERAVLTAFSRGDTYETLSAEMEKRFEITERHARLIARDQIGKLNGQVTRARHQEIGVNQFRWLSPMDPPRARPTHMERHRQSQLEPYSYDGTAGKRPPTMAGEEVCCRCTEAPVFEDVLAMVDALLVG